jgi:hypothetical protein
VSGTNCHLCPGPLNQSAQGAWLGEVVPVGRINLVTDAQLGWTHEFAGTERSVVESFTGAPGASFTVAGAAVPCATRRWSALASRPEWLPAPAST